MALGTILVPYDGSEPADAMLRLACRAIGEQGRVIVVYMTRIPPSLPLDPLPLWIDEQGDAALDRAEALAASLGVPIETWLTRVRHRVDGIVGEARVQEVDAVFLPQWSWRHPWRRLGTLRAARAVLRQVSCAVLVGTWTQGAGQRAAQDPLAAEPHLRVAVGTSAPTGYAR
jgi:nucleotide-binding universal stress UspA family protein